MGIEFYISFLIVYEYEKWILAKKKKIIIIVIRE